QTCTATWKRNSYLERGSTPTLITRRAPHTTSWASTPRLSPHYLWPRGSPGGRHTYSGSRPQTPSSARCRSTTGRASGTSRGMYRTKRTLKLENVRKSQPDSERARGEPAGGGGSRRRHLGGADGAAQCLPRRTHVC